MRRIASSLHITVSAALLCLAFGGAVSAQADKPAASTEIRPFRIAVKDEVLTDLRERLKRTRLPDQIEGTDWEYGVPAAYMNELIAYWREKYDWRAQERKLNALDQYTTQLDGIELLVDDVRAFTRKLKDREKERP